MNEFAKKLDSLRREGESKREYAHRLGISPVQLSRYYSGVNPGRKVLERISRRTGVSVDWLLYAPYKEKTGEDEEIKRDAPPSGKLSDEDLLELAFQYLDQIGRINMEGREAIKEVLRDVTENDEFREKILSFHEFIKYQNNDKEEG